MCIYHVSNEMLGICYVYHFNAILLFFVLFLIMIDYPDICKIKNRSGNLINVIKNKIIEQCSVLWNFQLFKLYYNLVIIYGI